MLKTMLKTSFHKYPLIINFRIRHYDTNHITQTINMYTNRFYKYPFVTKIIIQTYSYNNYLKFKRKVNILAFLNKTNFMKFSTDQPKQKTQYTISCTHYADHCVVHCFTTTTTGLWCNLVPLLNFFLCLFHSFLSLQTFLSF